METSAPNKRGIRAIIEDDILKKEFDMDKRKFSRNYEGSFFLEAINAGATVDGNLVWSSKSFVPRSAMANLTVDLFGQSVNLLEVGGRAEGLEYLLESYFGPQGVYSAYKGGAGDDDDTQPRSDSLDNQKLNRVQDKVHAHSNTLLPT
jgi:hypothetical protein